MFDLKIITDLKDAKRLSKRYPEASRSVRTAKITESVLLLERAVRELTPEGAGPVHLRDTIGHEVNTYGSSIAGTVGTAALYGEPVEYGTRPHWPPPGPLEYWVYKKIGIGGTMARAIAFLIARKISKKGTKGAHMFEKGFERSEPQIKQILNEITDEIKRMIE